MARAGRPRKNLAARHPCGKIRRDTHDPTEAAVTYGTPETQARRTALLGQPNAHGEIDFPLAHLRGKLDADQLMAAGKAMAVHGRFNARAMCAPRLVSGNMGDFIQSSGGGEPVTPEDQAEAKQEYEQLRRAVLREVRHRLNALGALKAGAASRQAWREVVRLCKAEKHINLYALRLGLDAIIEHYDLKPEAKPQTYRQVARVAA